MKVPQWRVVLVLAFSVLGCSLGTASGFWLGRAMMLRAARSSLFDYAQSLTQHAEELSSDLNHIFLQPRFSRASYCSDEELAALHAQTFRSRDLKDIGRTRDGMLFCSAFLGRLAQPYVEGSPTLTLTNGARIYTDVAMLPSSYGDRATVVDSGDVNVVLSQEAFDRWSLPHTGYMIAATNRKTGKIAVIAGSPLPVDPKWVLSEGFGMASGALYRSQCSRRSPLCVVTAEAIADIWGWSRATQIAYAVMGALAGFGFGLAAALMFLQTTSLSYQLQRAIRLDSNALRLVYQPILDLNSRRCVGVEVLMRWTDRGGSPVAPDVFVRKAEEKGFIGELTEFVVRHATQEVGDLLRKHPDLSLSINVAAADMNGEALFGLLNIHVGQAGIHPNQINLELTERSTADLDRVRQAIQVLALEGYKVHVDDFGTGFSSLAYLGQLSVNAIKVDRAFTQTIGTDAVTATILPQILALAGSLGVDVIVEGVETEAQAQYLQSTDMQLQAQGWYFSRPMPAEALSDFLEANLAADAFHSAFVSRQAVGMIQN